MEEREIGSTHVKFVQKTQQPASCSLRHMVQPGPIQTVMHAHTHGRDEEQEVKGKRSEIE